MEYNTYEEIMEALTENYLEQKRLINMLKRFEIPNRPIPRSSEPANFDTAFNVPIALKNLLEIDKESLPVSTVTNLVYQYIKDHKLCDVKTSKIKIDCCLKSALGLSDTDELTFFNLQLWIKKLYRNE